MTKFHVIADRQTCILYAAFELGASNANKIKLQKVEGHASMYEVPCAGIFAPRGTKRECDDFRVRVAESAAYQRGKLGKPLGGSIRVERV